MLVGRVAELHQLTILFISVWISLSESAPERDMLPRVLCDRGMTATPVELNGAVTARCYPVLPLFRTLS